MLSADRHFHGLVLVGMFSSFLAFVDGSAETVGLGAGFQDVRSICDSIQQRFAQPCIRDNLRPFGKRQIRGHDDGCSFGSFGDHLKEKLRADLGQRHISNLVNRDQVVATPASHHAPQLQLVFGLHEFIHQPGGGGESDPPLLPTSGNTQPG